MNYEFSSSEELYKRVSPALNSKVREFRIMGYGHINSLDIWDYLIESNWKYANGLMLCDIVNDIFTCDCKDIDSYLKKRIVIDDKI